MPPSGPAGDDTRSTAAWFAAAVGFALILWLTWPGFMSSDSADQLMQARTGDYTTAHPPLMALTWSFTDRIVAGPGGLFILHAALFWFALGWLGRELFARPLAQIAFVLLIGCWPPVFGTVAHLWKDVPMLAFALLGVASLARGLRVPRHRWLALAIAAFACACAYRHNALPLVLPFVFVVAGRLGFAGARRWAATAGLVILIALAAATPARWLSAVQRDVWPVTGVWDLAAMSIEQDRMVVPEDWRREDLTVDDLRAAFQPWSNTTIYDTNKLRISIFHDLTDHQRRSLRSAWTGQWIEHPFAMFGHRLRLTALLLGWRADSVPDTFNLWLQDSPAPSISPATVQGSAARPLAVAALRATLKSPLFSGWLYVVVLTVAALTAWRSRSTPHRLFWPLVVSVALFLPPLFLAAPSAEFRYLLWPVVATMIVLALRFASPGGRDATRRTAMPAHPLET
jgi:hypothetical protein